MTTPTPQLSKYWQIQSKSNYNILLKSGMFFEFHPELSGDWQKDLPLIRNGKSIEVKQMEIQPTPQLTAMQQAIENIESMISIKNFQQWERLKIEFLAKEKQQMIDAWIDGDARICQTKSIEHAETYYTQTYKTI